MKQTRPDQRGQSVVEFALVIPLFLLLLFALIDFSRLLFTYVSMANGAREMARSVSIVNNTSSAMASAFNNLTIIGGGLTPATSVTFSGSSLGGSGTLTCTATSENLCTIQVITTPPSPLPSGYTLPSRCAVANTVCLVPAADSTATVSGAVSYPYSAGFNYSLNPTGNGDFVGLSWLYTDLNIGRQQGFMQMCGLRYPTACGFPSTTDLQRGIVSDGAIQVDLRYNFQFNPLFQTRLDGIIDVSFMRPTALITTTVRTYAE